MQTMARQAFMNFFRSQWRQGEHLTIIGPTGSGKTTLGLELLSASPYTAIIATKQEDSTIDTFHKKHKKEYRIIRQYKDGMQGDKYIIWPKLEKDAGDTSKQTIPIRDSLNVLFFQGAWTVFCDELWLLTNRLQLSRYLESFWSQGRSSGLTVMGCVQRPAFIPRMAFSEPRYLLIGQMEDRRDIETVSNGTNINQKSLGQMVNTLSRHSFLFYSRNERDIIRINEK